jgi:putative pyruvate formate lyase activating enzyme
MFRPSYLALYESGRLKDRVDELYTRLATCDICPRNCGVNRLVNIRGYCRSGKAAEISSYCDHHGEEPALSGTKGSGTIFFSHCNLRCVYCQNHQISQDPDPSSSQVDSMSLARIMLDLQDRLGCHNINLVSPSHYVPQIIAAIYEAIPMGLKIPIVYNTNAYDSVSTLHMLDGIIDIYLPDIKYSKNKFARKFSHSTNYIAFSRAAIIEMHNQVGNLIKDASGIAQRGLIVRHLILPNNIAGSIESLKWLAKEISPETTLSIMSQYYPCHKAKEEPLLCRKISLREYGLVADALDTLDMENGWLQEMDSADHYLPDFERPEHPFEAP